MTEPFTNAEFAALRRQYGPCESYVETFREGDIAYISTIENAIAEARKP